LEHTATRTPPRRSFASAAAAPRAARQAAGLL